MPVSAPNDPRRCGSKTLKPAPKTLKSLPLKSLKASK